MTIKDFISKPFQKQFIPSLIALVMGVACTAVDHGSHRLVPIFVWLFFAYSQIRAAGQLIDRSAFWCFVVVAAIFSSLAVMMVFAGAWLAMAFAAGIALFPISVLAVRQVKQPNE